MWFVPIHVFLLHTLVTDRQSKHWVQQKRPQTYLGLYAKCLIFMQTGVYRRTGVKNHQYQIS